MRLKLLKRQKKDRNRKKRRRLGRAVVKDGKFHTFHEEEIAELLPKRNNLNKTLSESTDELCYLKNICTTKRTIGTYRRQTLIIVDVLKTKD